MEFSIDLSTGFVRRSRDRIKLGVEGANQALQTLGSVLTELTKMLAPFTPFLADFIYKDLTGNESVHLAAWSKMDEVDEKVLSDMEIVREIVSVGLSARKDKALAVRQPLAFLATSTGCETSISLCIVVRVKRGNFKNASKTNAYGSCRAD